MSEKKKIIFLVRAYNDLDIQASLINEFAQDQNYEVLVVAGFCDNEIFIAEHHEAFSYLSSQGVQFKNVLENSEKFLTRTSYAAYKWLINWRRKVSNPVLFFVRTLLIFVRNFMQKQANTDQSWLRYVEELSPSYLVIDEVVCQSGRSKIVDVILPKLKKKQTVIFSIVTGHKVYFDMNPSGVTTQIPYLRKLADKFYVPAQLDLEVCKHSYPDENYLIKGNLRMDRSWISKIHENILVSPFFPIDAYRKALPNKDLKIVLMLSKLSYGVRIPELVKCMKFLNQHRDVSFVIKPHTRGMKFDFMEKSDVDNAVIADNVPSAVLCEWADLQLFTGSSIVFHAMAQDKSVGFLGYCQEIRTLFDEHEACLNYDSHEQLERDIQAQVDDSDDRMQVDQARVAAFMDEHVWGGVPGDSVAKAYKEDMERT